MRACLLDFHPVEGRDRYELILKSKKCFKRNRKKWFICVNRFEVLIFNVSALNLSFKKTKIG